MKYKAFKFKQFIRKNSILIIPLFVLVFPLIIGLLYHIPCKQIIAVDSGDLLSYYSVSFGILGSFWLYHKEQNDRMREHLNKIAPSFTIDIEECSQTYNVDKQDDNKKVFSVTIQNPDPSKIFSDIYYYDQQCCHTIDNEVVLTVGYNLSDEEYSDISKDKGNILCVYDAILNGLPKSVYISCYDVENNLWECIYKQQSDGNHRYYHLTKKSTLDIFCNNEE